ncbi:MAG: ABC transporter ATP-binding protein [Gammaproteobacteria bacterium]|nr:ABC transporter ATP-binding protein [Gammaproteobacteria bacterium]
MSELLLDVKDLILKLHLEDNDTTLLKSVSFSLKCSETLALVGESGSGKSLTALAIMQLLPPGINIVPTSSILFQGQDLLTFSELKMRQVRGKKIAIIFQEAITALNPVMTIGEQIVEVLNFHFDLTRKDSYQRTLSLLQEVGMPTQEYYYKAYPHQLSGGLKQRAMIAIALAGEPSLLIADEPTTALDVTLQAQIIKLLKTLQAKRGMGLIFITHDLGIVYEIADQVVVLYKGQVVETASSKNFFESPQHPYSKKLFTSLPTWLAHTKREAIPNEKSLLKVENLKVYYPIKQGILKRTVDYIKAVDDVNFVLGAGRTLALVGESGSGKTTTGMAIARLARITGGQIYFDHTDLAYLRGVNLRSARKDIQVVFQDPYGSMNPRMVINDIIMEGIRSLKIPIENKDERVNTLLQQVGLDPEVKFRYPHEFSGGQRQRICIARALAVQPKLLICDEPTSALDVSAQMQVLQLLLKLQKEMGLTYLLITHNIAVVAYMADDVAVMRGGKIVEAGSVSEVLSRPKNPYTQDLLEAVPMLPKSIKIISEST